MRALALALLLCGCAHDGQIRDDANRYRVELNGVAQRIDEYAATAALACQFRDQIDAIKAPCRHLVDIDDGLRVAFTAAHAAVDLAESTGVVVDDGVRVFAKTRRLVDEYGEAVHAVVLEVRNVLGRDADKAGDDSDRRGGETGERPAPTEGPEAKAGPESSGAAPEAGATPQ